MNGPEVDDIAAKALGAMILEATALAVADDGKQAEKALTELAGDSGLVLEACAAILYATSFLAGVGDVAPEDIYAAALAWQPEPDELEVEVGPPTVAEAMSVPGSVVVTPTYTIEPLPAEGGPHRCEWCDSTAIGLVNGRATCFVHTDDAAHLADDDAAPYRDDNENGPGEEE